MNRKGQMAGVGALILTFVAIVVGIAMFQASAPSVGNVVSTNAVVNKSFTLPANGASITLDGQAVSNVIVLNRTGSTYQSVPSSNYTITNYYVSNGQLSSILTLNDATFASKTVNITYTYEPLGYATNGGARAVTSIILVLFTLAIAAIVLYAIKEQDVLGILGR